MSQREILKRGHTANIAKVTTTEAGEPDYVEFEVEILGVVTLVFYEQKDAWNIYNALESSGGVAGWK